MNTPHLPAPVIYVSPVFEVFGVGPCSLLMTVTHDVTEGWGDDVKVETGLTTTLGITPDGPGKWKFYAGSTAAGIPHFWDLHSATALEAFVEAWSELAHEEYITSFAQSTATAFTLGQL